MFGKSIFIIFLNGGDIKERGRFLLGRGCLFRKGPFIERGDIRE